MVAWSTLARDAEAAELGEGGGVDLRAGLGVQGDALAGDGGLVDARAAGEDGAVDGDRLAWSYDHGVADAHLFRGHGGLVPVALDAGRGRR